MRSLMVCLLVGFSVLACNGGDGAGSGSGGGGSAAAAKATAAVVATAYTYELSGAGVTFSADLHGYEQVAFGGNQTNPTYATVPIVGAQVVTYTLTAESMIASFTLNTGAGVLTITTKKNGVPLRVDTINTNATSISINN